MVFLRFLEGIRSPLLDTVISLVTQLGEELVGVVIFCVIFWCISKRVGYRLGVAFFLSGMTVQGMKICFRIDRPWIIDPTLKPVPSAIEAATGYSFPSGHTQSAVSLYGSLGAQIKQKLVKALCFFVAILVAFSRMYLGVHTPLDVVASLLISSLFVLLAVKVFNFDTVNKKREVIILLLMVLYAVAVIVIAVILYLNKMIGQDYVSDCLKGAGGGIGFAVGMFVERVYIDFPVETKKPIWQVIKFILGFAGVVVIKEGLKLIIGTGLVVDMFRYFLMIAWVIGIFPLIIKRFFAKNI